MFEIYQEPLFLLFPVASMLIGAMAFILFALPLHYIAVKDSPVLRRYRLDPRPVRARPVWSSLFRFAINLCCTLTLAVVLWPVLRLAGVHAGAFAWLECLWQLPLFFVIDDICFYFLHRLLHTHWLCKHVHAVHHRISAPTALAGAYFHPLEYVLITLSALVGPLLLGAHICTIWMWAAARQWLAADGHSGYALPYGMSALLPGCSARFHGWHHRHFSGNYANFLTALDHWFGTLAPGYPAASRRGIP